MGCAERGLRSLVLEAGQQDPIPGEPDLLAAQIDPPQHHAPTDIVSASALGGTSHWWHARAVEFDQVDFDSWPITLAELAPWYADAATWLGVCPPPRTPPPPAFTGLRAFDAAHDELYCPQANMARRWRRELRATTGPDIVLGARVVDLLFDGAKVVGVKVLAHGVERVARARTFVIACGGLGSLRLLLLAARERGDFLGGGDGPLGRGYMGHLTGSIAHMKLSNPRDSRAFGFRALGAGVIGRRQIRARDDTVRRTGINHIAWWFDNALEDNPAHGSSVASAKHVMARMIRRVRSPTATRPEPPLKPHLVNMARAPWGAVVGIGELLHAIAQRRLTGRIVNPTNFLPTAPATWYVRYHAEQRPTPENRVSLSESAANSIGQPQLKIQFSYAAQDLESVVRAHELLDEDLQQAGAGELVWLGTRAESIETVRALALDGYHQLGGAAMSDERRHGVVDKHCRTHDVSNLFVVSGSVFPTGGQANPTLTIVALARRLAARLAGMRVGG